ncbi:MAG: sortase [Patescibacteria group bacterium]|jgi:LPXTG-site transpeptidase (sortase) family protein
MKIFERKPGGITSKALVLILELLAIGLALYIIILPVYPELSYWFFRPSGDGGANFDSRDLKEVKIRTEEILGRLPKSEGREAVSRIIIPKIGVDAPIIESPSAEAGLAKGAWREPESSTPDKGGNTVITGHRFKYLPPSNLTFYLLHKLEPGDIIAVTWENKNYFYSVEEIKKVQPDDLSILAPSGSPILTLYTCDPIYSQERRLVIKAALKE